MNNYTIIHQHNDSKIIQSNSTKVYYYTEGYDILCIPEVVQNYIAQSQKDIEYLKEL